MTTKTISTSIASYDIVTPVTSLTVTGTGTVGAGGVSAGSSGAYTVANSGHIGTTAGSGFGVRIPHGGTVINSASRQCNRTSRRCEGAADCPHDAVIEQCDCMA